MSQTGNPRGGKPARPARRRSPRRAGCERLRRRHRGCFRLRPLLRDALALRRAWLANGAVRVGLPASLHLLPQSRYLASEGRNLRLGATVIDRLGDFAPALRALDGGLTISGGEPMVQLAFTRRILAAPSKWACTLRSRPRAFSVTRADDRYLSVPRSRLLDIKSGGSGNLSQGDRPRACADAAVRRAAGSDRQADLGPFHAGAGPHGRSRQCRGIARFVAPMKNVEWVEVQPFHQTRRLQMEGDEPRIQGRRLRRRLLLSWSTG